MALASLTLIASGLLIAAFALAVVAGLDMTLLLVTTPLLQKRRDLRRFRRMVTRQRWASLGVILLLVGAGVAALVGLVGGWVRPDELPFTFGAGVPLLVVELWVRYVQDRVTRIPAASPALLAERDRVVQMWEESPIPDW